MLIPSSCSGELPIRETHLIVNLVANLIAVPILLIQSFCNTHILSLTYGLSILFTCRQHGAIMPRPFGEALSQPAQFQSCLERVRVDSKSCMHVFLFPFTYVQNTMIYRLSKLLGMKYRIIGFSMMIVSTVFPCR